MKLLANRALKRVLALFLTVVCVFGISGSYTPARQTVYATEEPAEPATSNKYFLVTDDADLVVGDKVVIAAASAAYSCALSTNQKTNNRGQAAVTKDAEDKSISWTGEDVQILTLEKGKKDNTFAFYTGSGYLYAASSSNNHLKTQTTLNDNGSFTVAITDGVATLTAQGANTHNVMQYYTGSDGLFACYESAKYEAVALYKHLHTVADWTEEPKATCTEAGTKSGACAECGATVTEEVPALGHNYVDNECTRCHDTVTHTCVYEGEGEVTTAPACETEGVRSWTCTVADCTEAPKTEAIAALGHSLEERTVTEPTCTVAGAKVQACTREGCDHTEGETAISALGHTWANGTCSVCSATQSIFVLVENAADLKAGDELIIVSASKEVALSTTQNENNRGSAPIEKDGKIVTAASGDGVQLLTLEAGTKDNTFALNTGAGYLYAASSGSNWLRTQAENTDNGSWTIDIVDGKATIIAQGDETNKYLREYNSAFSCYNNETPNVAIYKKVNGVFDFTATTTEASFKLSYTSGALTGASLRFGMTISTTLCESLNAAGATYGVEVNNGSKTLLCEREGFAPVQSGDVYMLGAVIGGLDGKWDVVHTARVYVKIGGKTYYMQEIAYSVNTLAQYYQTVETDDAVLEILEILAGTTGGAA